MVSVGKWVGLTLVLASTAWLERAHAAEGADIEQEQSLRERLTEREDQNRIENPWHTTVFGHTLTVSGQYEFIFEGVDRLDLGDPDPNSTDSRSSDRRLLEQEIETEVFYTLGEPLSIFIQGRLAMEEDLGSRISDPVSSQFVERGEMWLVSENIAGTGLGFEIGRLDFEDDRRWWWDQELDAVRVFFEREEVEFVVAVARELAPDRSDRDYVEPQLERLLRVFGEASWEWRSNHVVEAFALYQQDHSPTQIVGQLVETEREDDSDADLSWWGARLSGAVETESAGIFAYWFDAAWVRGREKRLEFEEVSKRRSVVTERSTRNISGWALDVGTTWLARVEFEPRITVGYALGSGGRDSGSGEDHSFRQTALQSNEPGFGGVRSFRRYGTLLDPELSNLHVLTAAVGFSLFESSSVDFVYHYYRLFDRATLLLDARLDPELTGRDRDLGHGVDVVLAIEEWGRVQLDFVGSVFRGGNAFGADHKHWSYGGIATLSIAF